MKLKSRKAYVAGLVSASLILSFGIGCGKKPGSDSGHGSKTEETKEAAAPAAPAAGSGTIKGKVNFSGTAPEMPELNRQSDPFCAETKMNAQYIIVNSNNTLKNVAVRVMGAKGGTAERVEVDQKNCMYEPRVQATLSNEEIDIVNSDPTLHNVHTYSGSKTLFNRAQPKGSPAIKKKFDIAEGDIIKFKCDVHPWMTGWLVLGENAFNSVTGDSGEFEIKGVPAGTYKLKAFHENYGEKEIEVTVEADKVAEAEFTYDGTEKAAFKYREVIIGAHDHHNH